MSLTAFVERLLGVGRSAVADRAVDEVEDEDRDDLHPPVDAVAVAELPSSRQGAAAGSAGPSSGPGPGAPAALGGSPVRQARAAVRHRSSAPRAKAGAPRRLAMRPSRTRRRRSRTPCRWGPPSGTSRTRASLARTPKPPTEIGATCAMATAGAYAITAAVGIDTPRGPHREPDHQDRGGLVGEGCAQDVERRAASAPQPVDPHVHAPIEAHPVPCSVKRPATRGAPAATSIPTRATIVTELMVRAIHALRSDRSPVSIRNPRSR